MSALSSLVKGIISIPGQLWDQKDGIREQLERRGIKKVDARYSTARRLNTREATRAVNKAVGREALQPAEEAEESALTDTAIAEAFIQAIKEQKPFAEETVSGDYYRYGGSDIAGNQVLRPRSAQPFLDKPAALKIVQDGNVGGDTPLLPKYTKFILSSVQEAHFERYQIIETFNDFYVFLFGEKPPIYNFGGTLINTEDINWLQDFMLLYEGYFRGTRCAENNARAILTFENRQMEGYILNITTQTQADVSEGVPFSFQMVITRRTYLGLSLDFDIITRDGFSVSINLLDNIVKEIASKEGKGSSDQFLSTAYSDALTSLTATADGVQFKNNPEDYYVPGQLLT